MDFFVFVCNAPMFCLQKKVSSTRIEKSINYGRSKRAVPEETTMAGAHEEELAGAEEADLLRSFSVPRVEPSELLRRSRADETAPPSRQRLLELWLRYWNAWETDSLPDGVWWDQDAIQGLLSDHVILIKPEGAFQGKEVVLDEYECFAKRFPASRKMERRLTDVFVDERRQTTTAAYEVIIPEGILPEDEDEEDGEGGGGGGKDREGGRLRRRQSATSRIFSVAEVLRWSLKDDESGKGPLLEVHYFGSGVRLTTSRIKGKLHRARQHRKRSGRGDEDVAELELGAFDFNLELGEDVVLDTSTVSDDRPLAQLTFTYISALLRSDKDQVLSLVAEDYKHLTAFGDSLAHFGPAAGGGKVKGEVGFALLLQDDEQRRLADGLFLFFIFCVLVRARLTPATATRRRGPCRSRGATSSARR